ncbi:hypothetical protein, partial [Rhodopirellula bahusiensis]|uniref:hypothetical protein n=1 Tax=Rhodopirellula bahusiensis TaxID=2014065 RepID=UPI0032975668
LVCWPSSASPPIANNDSKPAGEKPSSPLSFEPFAETLAAAKQPPSVCAAGVFAGDLSRLAARDLARAPVTTADELNCGPGPTTPMPASHRLG